MKLFAAFVLLLLHSSVESSILSQHRLEPSFSFSKSDVPVKLCSNGTGNYIKNIELDIKPNPIVVATGSSIEITVNVDLAAIIEPGATMELHIVKKGATDINIPCLSIGQPVPVGSCTYDVSKILKLVNFCPQLCPDGQKSDLPLQPGKYGGTGLKVVFRDIPFLVKPFLKGKFDVTGHIKDKKGNEIICWNLMMELTKSKLKKKKYFSFRHLNRNN